MATNAAAPPPPPPPPPGDNNKKKKDGWWTRIKKDKRRRKKARRVRINALFNAMMRQYNAAGGAEQTARARAVVTRVLQRIAEDLEERRHPHMPIKKE